LVASRATASPISSADVAGDAARAELGEQESALEDEVLLAEWVDADAVEEAFEQVLEHDLVGGCAGAAGEVAQVGSPGPGTQWRRCRGRA